MKLLNDFTITVLRCQAMEGDYYSQQVINSQPILAWRKGALANMIKQAANSFISGKSYMDWMKFLNNINKFIVKNF